MTLGQNIQNARRAQGLSQEALAEKSASAARRWASAWTRCRDDTQRYEMTAAPDGSFAADGIVFTVGSTYELSVQWTPRRGCSLRRWKSTCA